MGSCLILLVYAIGQVESASGPPASVVAARPSGVWRNPFSGGSSASAATPDDNATQNTLPQSSDIADLQRRLAALEARKSESDATPKDTSDDDENVFKVQWKNGLVATTADG